MYANQHTRQVIIFLCCKHHISTIVRDFTVNGVRGLKFHGFKPIKYFIRISLQRIVQEHYGYSDN